MSASYEIVVMGGSWGGMHAAGEVLASLPSGFAAPVVIVLHRSRDSSEHVLVTALQQRSRLRIEEAADKARLETGAAYLAPPDYHLLVDGGELALSTDEAVQYSRPSIDVLFESAADSYDERTIGVVLTGANADGAAGLAAIRRAGGFGVVQDPDDAERPEMPRAAIARAGADRVLPLAEIGPLLAELCGSPS